MIIFAWCNDNQTALPTFIPSSKFLNIVLCQIALAQDKYLLEEILDHRSCRQLNILSYL